MLGLSLLKALSQLCNKTRIRFEPTIIRFFILYLLLFKATKALNGLVVFSNLGIHVSRNHVSFFKRLERNMI